MNSTVVVTENRMIVEIKTEAGPDTVVIPDEKVTIVSVAEQGVPGQKGDPANTLDAMINPSYPASLRVFTSGPDGITNIKVHDGSGLGTLLFDRIIHYQNGRVSSVVTDDMINHKRLTKIISYDANGQIMDVSRVIEET